MLYVLIYLLVGMFYAGVTFKATLRSIMLLGLKEAELISVARGSKGMTDEEKTSAIACFILAIIYSIFKIPFYPCSFFFDLIVFATAKKKLK
ncbi:hypothetical protein EYH65_20520 [Bacillus subtilis]|nr:hypothetical protein [Bacillus subtilis]NLS42709.1 hypothetical protein [Bacillus subtilis]